MQDVLGLGLRTCGLAPAVDTVCGWLSETQRRPRSVGFVNPHVYNHCFHDPEVRQFTEGCDLVCIDGVGISLAARWIGRTRLERAVATQVFDRVLGRLRRRTRALLVGATPAEAQDAAAAIEARSAGFVSVRALDGYRCLQAYREAFEAEPHLDLVLVGMGTPRSEAVALLAREGCPHAVVWVVGGGTLRIYAGTKHRAPEIVSRLGLEWMHRIWFEPETRARYGPGAVEYALRLLQWRRAQTP